MLMPTLPDSLMFLIFSMVLIAASLYLPHHISFLANRAWFYYHGDIDIKSAAETLVPGDAAQRFRDVVGTVRAAHRTATGEL
jgi:hypothetical protein